ncbi:putative oligosaccharyl transferase complex, subunit OST3/OST6 [Helianthus debilis subsp. tardiflorus]
MSNPPKPPLILLLLILTIITHPSAAEPIISYLHTLRSQSPNGMINLNQTLTNLIVKPTTRSFHLIIFFDALKLYNQPEPDIRIVPPYANDLKSDSIRINIGDFSGLAESIAESIDLKPGISIGTIHHPPICSKTQFGLIIGGLLIWLPFITKRIITSNTVFHNKRTWIWICGRCLCIACEIT